MPQISFTQNILQNTGQTDTIWTRLLGMNQGAVWLSGTLSSTLLSAASYVSYDTWYGEFTIMKGTVPTDLSTITSYSQRSDDVLVKFGSGDFMAASDPGYYQNPAQFTSSFKAVTAAGTATWFWWVSRVLGPYVNTNVNTISTGLAGTIGLTGSGSDLEIPNTTLNIGQLVRVVNFRIAIPTTYSY